MFRVTMSGKQLPSDCNLTLFSFRLVNHPLFGNLEAKRGEDHV